MLNSDRATDETRHRLARDFRVAMRNRRRRLLVRAHDQLRMRVSSVVDDRFVNAAKGRARHRRDIVDASDSQQIDHEIRARIANLRGVGGGRFVQRRRKRFGRGQRRRRPAHSVFLFGGSRLRVGGVRLHEHAAVPVTSASFRKVRRPVMLLFPLLFMKPAHARRAQRVRGAAHAASKGDARSVDVAQSELFQRLAHFVHVESQDA
jgi:hypothetical protein